MKRHQNKENITGKTIKDKKEIKRQKKG